MSFHFHLYAPAAKWLLAGSALTYVALQSCARSKDRLEEMHIEEPTDYFLKEAFVEMVPPIRLPLRSLQNRVEVWLKIPTGSVMSLRLIGTQPFLALPPGSIAARVESLSADHETARFFAADVRGTRFGADAEHFFVLKPLGDTLPSSLHGWSWRRDSAAEQAMADENVAGLVGTNTNAAEREERLSSVRATNACASCHQHARLANDNPEQYGHVNRGTDDSGCFQVQSILSNELPVENYFPLEQNLDDGFISFWCGDAPATVVNRHVRCASGSVPRGRLAVREGWVARDEHVLKVCRSRQYLYEHLSDVARREFQQPLADCGIGTQEQKTLTR